MYVLVIALLGGQIYNDSGRALATVSGYATQGECWKAAAEAIAQANANRIRPLGAFCIPGPSNSG